jgi:hypothetical protein
MLKLVNKIEKHIGILGSIIGLVIFLYLFKKIPSTEGMVKYYFLVVGGVSITWASYFVIGGIIYLPIKVIAHTISNSTIKYIISDIKNNKLINPVIIIIAFIFESTVNLIIASVIFKIVMYLIGGNNYLKKDGIFFEIIGNGILGIIIIILLLIITLLVNISFKVNEYAIAISILGICFLNKNLNIILNEKFLSLDNIEKLSIKIEMLFGIIILILPWFFERSYKQKIKNILD